MSNFHQEYIELLEKSIERIDEAKKGISQKILKWKREYILETSVGVVRGSSNSNRSKKFKLVGTSFFVDEKDHFPASMNSSIDDVSSTKQRDVHNPPEVFSALENKELKKAMKRMLNQKKTNEILQSDRTELEKQNLIRELKSFQTTSTSNYFWNTELSEDEWTEVLSWSKVLPKSRSSFECQLQWKYVCNPAINHKKWKTEELCILKDLVQTQNTHDWFAISNKIGNGRTPFDCLRVYQRYLSQDIKKGHWTEEEDRLLLRAIQVFPRQWNAVAECLDGRSYEQCYVRWRETLRPGIVNGRWNEIEDRRLFLAIVAYGMEKVNFSFVTAHIPGRTDAQCRERWLNVINPFLHRGKWTQAETERLRASVQIHGIGKWALVANDVKSRTDNQCWRRWKTIENEEWKQYKINKSEFYGIANGRSRKKNYLKRLNNAEIGVDRESYF